MVDKKDNVAATAEFYDKQLPRWLMIDALMGGTETMRKAGDKYLPKFEFETDKNWRGRLQVSTLFNQYRKSVIMLSGKPFSKPMNIPEDLPEPLMELFEDVDGQGSTLEAFAYEAFKNGLNKGICHILIDFPVANPDETAAEDARKAPYAVLIQPENLISASREIIEGVETLTEVRIRECTMEQKGDWLEQEVERIRVYRRDEWILYKHGDKADEWVVEAGGKNTLGMVPMVTFYADREGFMCSRPPLMDLAFLNVTHWQSSSDQRNILQVTRFPLLAASGMNPEDKIEIGPNSFFAMRAAESKMYYVEHSGAAVATGRQDLEDLKANMAALGLQLLMPSQSGSPTATAKSLDAAEASTSLESLAGRFENTINHMVYIMGLWMGLVDPNGDELERIKFSNDWVMSLDGVRDMAVLLTARAGRDISRKALIEAFKRRDLLPGDFDVADDAEQMQEETQNNSTGGALPDPTGIKVGLLKEGDPQEKPIIMQRVKGKNIPMPVDE